MRLNASSVYGSSLARGRLAGRRLSRKRPRRRRGDVCDDGVGQRLDADVPQAGRAEDGKEPAAQHGTGEEVIDALLMAFPALGLTKIVWAVDVILAMKLPEFDPEFWGG